VRRLQTALSYELVERHLGPFALPSMQSVISPGRLGWLHLQEEIVAAPPRLDEVLSVQPVNLPDQVLEVLPWLLLRGYPERDLPWLARVVIGPGDAE
jgi:hypothetical protein